MKVVSRLIPSSENGSLGEPSSTALPPISMLRRTFLAAPFALAAASALSRVYAAEEYLVAAQGNTEEFLIPADDPGVQLYLRNKRSVGAGAPSPARTVLFVHGLSYPASAVFDLALEGQSWMDFIAARGFDVWCVDIRGYGRSSRPPEFDQAPSDNPPILDAATATRDLATASAFIRQRRGLPSLTVLAWSWGTI